MKDAKSIHQIIRDRDSWQDGWSRVVSTGWTLVFVGAVVVFMWVAS